MPKFGQFLLKGGIDMENRNEIETLSPAEIQRRFCIPIATLAFWRWARTGPRFYKVGRKVLYGLEDMQDFLEARKVDQNGG
jgi:hypothetical protein